MINKNFIFLFLGLFLISLASASYTPHELNKTLEFSISSNKATTCVLTTINSPYGVISINQEGTALSKTFNFTILANNYSQIGTYCHNIECTDGVDIVTGRECREITPTGRLFGSGQTLGAIAILLGALGLAFLFMFLAGRLSENTDTMPISLLFLALSLGFVIYVLHLSYVYSVDILMYSSLTGVTSVIYISLLWILTGMAIISMALMLISMIKQIKQVVETKKFGNDWNYEDDIYS